jgi:NADH-quinone oxidoreductase subunit L
VSLVATLLATAIGVFIAWSIYFRRSPTPESVGAATPGLYRLVSNRWYVDELYDWALVRPIKWSGRMIYRFFEVDVLDGTINGTVWVTRWFSRRSRDIQTGYVRNYAMGILFGAVLLMGYYVLGGR